MLRSLIFVLLLASLAAAQSLGDAARAARANKQKASRPKERVVTNESLEMLRGKMSDASVKTTADASASAETKPGDAADKDKAKAESKDEAAAADEKKKQLADDTAKAKAELEQLTRELDVLQRENRLRAATYYADAGNRLRDEKKYAEDDRRYQQDIQSKQSAIAAAKAKLDDLNEQARKMGSR